MTDHPDHRDDAFEQLARRAGAALHRPAPVDGVARLQTARRRQRIVRASLAAGTSVVVIVVGLIVVTRPADDSVAPSGSADATTVAPSTTSTTSTTSTPSTTATPAPLSLAYTLSGVEGLASSGNPERTDASGDTSLVAAWSAAGGISNGYLVLSDTQAPVATSPEGDVTSGSLDVPDGHAFVVTDNGFETLTSATRIMWWRADGRLWIVSNFGLTPARLTALTLAIQPGSGLPYVLADPSMAFVGFNTSESFESITQDWMLDGSHLTLAATTGGLAQQLAGVSPQSIVERTVAGVPGYAITLTNGQVNLAWPTDNPDHWGSLIISAPLAERIDEIVAAITSR